MSKSEIRLASNISKFVRGGCKVCDALPLLAVPATYEFVCERLCKKVRNLRVAAFQTQCTAEAREEFAGCVLPKHKKAHI